jgi:hypothetical protein
VGKTQRHVSAKINKPSIKSRKLNHHKSWECTASRINENIIKFDDNIAIRNVPIQKYLEI